MSAVKVGRGYVAFSVALLPAVVAGFAVVFGLFRENGSQSAGAGPLALIALATITIVGGNALLAILLAWGFPALRPYWPYLGLLTMVLIVCATIGVVVMRVL